MSNIVWHVQMRTPISQWLAAMWLIVLVGCSVLIDRWSRPRPSSLVCLALAVLAVVELCLLTVALDLSEVVY